MNQSTIVFFFLLFAFLIFITQRGELPAYLALLYGGGTPTTVPQTGGGGATPTAATPQSGGSDAFGALSKTASAAVPYAVDALMFA